MRLHGNHPFVLSSWVNLRLGVWWFTLEGFSHAQRSEFLSKFKAAH